MVEIFRIDRPPLEVIRKVLVKEIGKNFGFDIGPRLKVVADVDQFTAEDRGVWAQHRGKRQHYYELYWDSVWICDFDGATSPDLVVYKFLVGFKNAFEAGQIHLHAPDEYDAAVKHQRAEEVIQAEIKKLENRKIEGDQDDIVRQVLKETLEEKKEQKKKIRRKAERKYGN